MATLLQSRIGPEEYVALEQKLGVKHECHAGQMFAMASASAPHSRLHVTADALQLDRFDDRDL